jgi:hypothetical protein
MQLFGLHGGLLTHPVRRISWRAHTQLFSLHGGLLAHPIRKSQLGGPHAAVHPARWSIGKPNGAKSAGRPTYSYSACTVAH